MTHKEFEDLKNKFLVLGGNERLIRSLSSPTLQNEARLKYEIRKLEKNIAPESNLSTPAKHLSTPVPEEDYQPKADFKDFISEYPPQLHEVYMQRRQAFLEACSLKIILNAIPENSEKKAGKLQWEIWEKFQEMDKCQKILNHWKETKRIMPTETKEDFSDISKAKLDLKRRNLRSNRSKRIKTINKIKAEMPDVEDPTFQLKHNQLNRKLEALAELELQIEKLTELINDE